MEDNYLDILNGAQEIADFETGAGTIDGSFLEKWFMPGVVQQREFGQQVALQKYQNEWNSEGAKLKRMTAAGINPYLAAQGIAGGAGYPSPSVGGVPSTPDGVSPSDFVGAANAVTGGAASLAEAGFKNATKNPTVENLGSQTFLNLQNGGLSKWQAKSIEQTLPIMTENMRADYYQKLATINETWQRYENLKSEHDNIVATYSEILARTDLSVSQKEYTDSLKALNDENIRWQKAENDFWENEGYLRSDNVHQAIIHCKSNGKDPSFIGDCISDYTYKISDAEQRAVEEHSYQIAYNESLAKSLNSWKERPNSLWASIASVGTDIGSDLKAGKISHDKAKSELKSQKDFNKAYNDFKSDMLSKVNEARKAYKHAKRYLGKDARVEAYYEWQKLVKIYDEFDEEDFSELLLGQF